MGIGQRKHWPHQQGEASTLSTAYVYMLRFQLPFFKAGMRVKNKRLVIIIAQAAAPGERPSSAIIAGIMLKAIVAHGKRALRGMAHVDIARHIISERMAKQARRPVAMARNLKALACWHVVDHVSVARKK